MKTVIYRITLSIVLSSGLLVAAENDKITCGKKLTSPQMYLLNKQLDQNPLAIARTKITCARCAKAILAVNEIQEKYEATHKQNSGEKQASIAKKYFESNELERAFISKHLKLVLEPVKKFFEDILSYKSFITPVIVESLGEKSSKSLLIKFLTTNENVSTFFEHEIKTIEDLKDASVELITVFNDLNENLSKETKKKCDEIIQEMIDAKKKPEQKQNQIL